MPTKLPPRRARVSEETSDFSPLLGMVAAMLALLVVLAEAHAIGLPNQDAFVAEANAIAVPF